MDDEKNLKRLAFSSDLLIMLERLVEHLAAEPAAAVPWDGIKITLAQSRRQVQAVAGELKRGGYVRDPARTDNAHPLMRRIRRVPKKQAG